ncbi:6599_t:CDS:2, partial [Acaulospora colombiana]
TSTPVIVPSTPSATTNASTSGTNTPKENGVPSEETLEDKTALADQLKENGNVAFKARNYEDAIKLYTEAIAPSQAAYYANRAAALIATKDFRAALIDCQQARTLQQDAPQVKTLVRLARCQLAIGSPGPALSTLREAQALSTETNRDLWNFKTNAETMQRHLDSIAKARGTGDWTTASAALEAARKMLEGDAKHAPTEWRCWSVEFRMARKDWNGATDAIRDALRYEGNSPDVHALRGKVLFLMNKPSEATSILRHALTLDPENATARKMLKRVKELEKVKEEGNTAFKRSQWEDAVLKYTEALKVVGESPEEGEGGIIRAILLSNRALGLSKMATAEKYEEALSDLELSLQLYPDSWKAVRTRARIRLAQDDFEQAIADFREALELAEGGVGNEGAQSELQDELRKAEVLLKRSKEKDYY